ncbi:MAG: hypothetical protein M3N52_05320 [Actinomycetota bacterium]|nr:hypothetical protein [Actinomycetota bacterium]
MSRLASQASTRYAPRSDVSGHLDTVAWGHVTGRYRALGHDFCVRTSDPALGRYCEEIFSAFAAPGRARSVYSVLDRGERTRKRYAVYHDGERIALSRSPSHAFGTLLWHVNQSVVASTTDVVLVHAAAAERGGAAVLLPAPMESGKTTLVAGLVRRGLRYLTDEAVAVDPVTSQVRPFPKALSIDRGSWQVLADLRPDVDPAVAAYTKLQWQVPAEAIRPGALAPPALPRLVVAPRYEAGSDTTLRPVSRARMLTLMAESTFNFHAAGRRNLEVLARVVRRSDCYLLTVGDLARACTLVLDALSDLPAKEGNDDA